MSWHKGLLPIIATGFLLNGVVPFSLYLLLGLIYTIGGTYQIIALVVAVVAGSYIFTALGLFLSRLGRVTVIIPLALTAISFIVVYLRLSASMVLTLEDLWVFAFMNMSSNSVVSFFVSMTTRSARGRVLSVKHFLSIGTGSPIIFFLLMVVYIYLNYSNLPLITLSAEVFAFLVSVILIRLSFKTLNSGGVKSGS